MQPAPHKNRSSFSASFALAAVLVAVACIASTSACEGCKSTDTGSSLVTPTAPAGEAKPTLRLYLVSNLAGALEPCGCVKDQLGGFDHFAALVTKGRDAADASAVLLAGPTFFMEPALDPDKRAQDITKAEALAGGLKQTGAFAFAPGKNDFAAGPDELAKLAKISGGSDLFANRVRAAGTGVTPGAAVASGPSSQLLDAHGLKLGVIGASGLTADYAVAGITADASAAAAAGKPKTPETRLRPRRSARTNDSA